MRYAIKQTLRVSLLTALFLGPALGQETESGQPELFSQAVASLPGQDADRDSTWSGLQQTPRLPQAENDGSVQGATLAERMRSIRRRAADSDISRPFNSEDAGDLPVVKRRPLGPVPAEGMPQAVPELTLEQTLKPTEPMPAPPTAAPPLELEAMLPPIESSPVVERRPTAIETQPIPAAIEVVEMPPLPMANTRREDVILHNNAPALSFETAGPRSIVIGKEATYQVTMRNLGDADARNVICTVKLPTWAEVVSNSSSVGAPRVESGSDDFTNVQWEIPNIEAGDKETLTLRIVPRDSRPFDLAVGWTFTPGSSMAQIEVQEPKLEVQLSGSEEVEYGETGVYTITISNPGTGDAENVVLNLLPMASGQQIAGTRNLGTIPAGERKTMELELMAHQAGRLQVRAMAYADNGLRSEASQDVLVRRANLEVAVMGPPRNFAATTATYKVRVENTGNAMAEETQAVASLPAGAKFLSSTDGGRFDEQRGQVEWNVGSLRPGAVRVLEIRCELHSSGENRVDFQCHSSQDVRVTRSIVTMVEALADLKLYVNDPQGAIPVGQEAEYEIRIVNRGTKAAENVQLVGYFSHGIEPEAITRGGHAEIGEGQVVFEPVGSIGPDQEKVFRIAARAHTPGNHVFRAELQCRSPETRLAAEEWTKYFSAPGGSVQQASGAQVISR